MPITAEFLADFDKFNEGVKSGIDSLNQLIDQTAKVERDTEETTRAAAETGKALREFGETAVEVGKKYVDAYAAEQEITNRLAAALGQQGEAADETIHKYEELAKTYQTNTRYSADAILKAETLLTTIGQITPDQMESALKAVTNMAAETGKSLDTITMIVARVGATGGEHLGRLKAYLGDAAAKGDDMNTILEKLNAKFSGGAAKDMESWNAQMLAVSHQSEEAEKSVGKLIVNALSPLVAKFLELNPALQSTALLTVSAGESIFTLATKFAPVVTAVSSLIPLLAGSTGLAAAWTALSAAIVPLLPLIGTAGLIVVGIVAVYEAIKHWDDITRALAATWQWFVGLLEPLFDRVKGGVAAVTEFFKSMYEKVAGHSYVPDTLAVITDEFGKLWDVMVKPTQEAVAATEQSLSQVQNAVEQLASNDSMTALGDTFGQLSHVTRGAEAAANASPFTQVMSAFGDMWVALKSTGQLIQRLEPKYGAGGFLGYGTPGIGIGETPTMTAWRMNPITINVQGSVLSTRDELAKAVGDAMTYSYGAAGNRLPV
jgi:ABC-type transporter Mla subunit MlaD